MSKRKKAPTAKNKHSKDIQVCKDNKNNHAENITNNIEKKESDMKEKEQQQSATDTNETGNANSINILDFAGDDISAPPIETVRLGSDETAIIAFTMDGEVGNVHYCQEDEIRSYVHCNGQDCVLCRIGRKKIAKIFLPIYLPMEGKIGILTLSKSMTPKSLLPKIINILKAEKSMVMFITFEQYNYKVSTQELADDSGGDMPVIKKFQEEYDAGKHDLKSVYSIIDNDELASIDEIAKMLMLKGDK